jgi:hypothetical protein
MSSPKSAWDAFTIVLFSNKPGDIVVASWTVYFFTEQKGEPLLTKNNCRFGTVGFDKTLA